jgi:hypothetical protein
MSIFRRYVDDLAGLVPTILRRVAPVTIDDEGRETSANVINLAYVVGELQPLDALGAALAEMAETDWPLATAAGWVLDDHWGPFHGLQRNGSSDADYRTFIRAKRMLNRSWGAADQALAIFKLLLPTADLAFLPWYPKAWEIIITGVDMATALPAVNFMTKRPSPLGGGFSVCGDNGFATIIDAECFNYSSVYGTLGVEYDVTGFYGSVYGAGGGAQAGFAHVQGI